MISFLYVATFAVLVLISMKIIKKKNGMSLLTVLVLAIGFLYLLVPALVFMFGSYNMESDDLIGIISESSDAERIVIYFWVLLCIAVILIPQKIRIKKTWATSCKQPSSADDYDAVRVRHITYNVCRMWFWVLFLVGLGCTLIMIADIGLGGFIAYSGSSRGEGALELQSGSLFAYASNFSKWLIASLVPGIMMYEIKKKLGMKVLLIIVFALSVLLQIFNAGKTNFILFLIPFFIYVISKKGTFKMRYLVLAGVAVILLVPFLDNTFYYISTGSNINSYRASWGFMNYVMSIVRQFTYPYCNMVMRVPITDIYGYRWFLDYLAIPVNLIPASLIGGFQIETLYHLTTEYYAPILSSGGGMPNDFLFFSYRQLGVLGIVIIGTIVGAIVKKLDKDLLEIRDLLAMLGINTSHFITTYWLAGVVFILIEPLSMVTSFPMAVFTIIIVIHLKHRLKGARILSK